MSQSRRPAVTVHAPCRILRPFIKRFVIVDFEAPCADAHLPDTGLVAAFRVRGECRLDDGSVVSRAVLTGLHDRLRRHAHGPGNGMALAVFTPIGAAAFLRFPLDETANRSVPLEDCGFASSAIDRIEALLAMERHSQGRIARLEQFFLGSLSGAPVDALVGAAVSWIERAPPGARITQLVRAMGLSQSALERRFRRVVGTSPRRFASIVRMQNVLRLRASGMPLTTIAHEAGYFDQAHFIHDFKRIAGCAPQAYFARSDGD